MIPFLVETNIFNPNFSKSTKFDFSQVLFNSGVDYRSSLIRLLSRIGGKQLDGLSESILSEFMIDNKTVSIFSTVYGIAGEGNYYRARQAIPSTVIEVEDLYARSIIVWHACMKKETEKERGKWAGFDNFFDDFIDQEYTIDYQYN